MFDHIGLHVRNLRPDHAPTYYAAFVLDPDGNNLEAVCMEAR
jgi:hypothetical protein